jgi:hypothetical protein
MNITNNNGLQTLINGFEFMEADWRDETTRAGIRPLRKALAEFITNLPPHRFVELLPKSVRPLIHVVATDGSNSMIFIVQMPESNKAILCSWNWAQRGHIKRLAMRVNAFSSYHIDCKAIYEVITGEYLCEAARTPTIQGQDTDGVVTSLALAFSGQLSEMCAQNGIDTLYVGSPGVWEKNGRSKIPGVELKEAHLWESVGSIPEACVYMD